MFDDMFADGPQGPFEDAFDREWGGFEAEMRARDISFGEACRIAGVDPNIAWTTIRSGAAGAPASFEMIQRLRLALKATGSDAMRSSSKKPAMKANVLAQKTLGLPFELAENVLVFSQKAQLPPLRRRAFLDFMRRFFGISLDAGASVRFRSPVPRTMLEIAEWYKRFLADEAANNEGPDETR